LSQQHSTCRNTAQQGGQTRATMLRPTMLQCVALAWCDRLAGALTYEMKNNYCLFESLFQNITVAFSFLEYHFFVVEILTFLYYAN